MTSRNGRSAAIDGWRSPLAIATGGLLLGLAATGLWIYLAPFSVGGQLQVLLHTLLGLLFVVPGVVYLVRHFAVWWRQKVTATMVLGYLLALLVVVCGVSGLVVTWQAALGPRLARFWDLTHLLSGLAVTGLLVAHLLGALFRRLAAARRDLELAAAMRRFGGRATAAGLLPMALALMAAPLLWPKAPVEHPLPEGYSLPEYAQQFDEYRGSPFAPSYARTASGKLVEPWVLAGSASCGTAGCHQEILAEWEPSAHRFSAMNPPFQAVQREFAVARGAAETRYCAGCHDPISLFAGAKDIHNLDLSAPGMQEGISCVVCHTITQADQRGNADFVLEPPRRYLWEDAERVGKWVSDFLIRAYPRQHLADYDRPLLRTAEYCGACHKQFIPEALNRFGLVAGQNQYDEWRNSHWHTGEEETTLSCRDCHMRLVPGSSDPARGRDDGDRRRAEEPVHRHHGFIAANNFMPRLLDLPGWEEHTALTDEWLRGETVLPEIAHLFPAGPVASLRLLAPESARPGEELTFRVVVANDKAGHYFTTGPHDFIQAWLQVRVVGEGGEVVAEWGALDPESGLITDHRGAVVPIGNARDEGTLVLAGMPVDEDGNLLLRHELWEAAGGTGKRVIFPHYSDAQTFRLTLPEGAQGLLTLEADLQYRRYRQDFLDLVLPGLEAEAGVDQPVVVKASDRRAIQVAP
jgi:hypothetical protein